MGSTRGCNRFGKRPLPRASANLWQNACISCPRRPPATRHSRARRKSLAPRQASRRAQVCCFGRHQEFIRSCASNRLEDERRLLVRLAAAPFLRRSPNSAFAAYCSSGRHSRVRTRMPMKFGGRCDMLGHQTIDAEPAQRQARDIAFLSASLEGLGLMRRAPLSRSLLAYAATTVPEEAWSAGAPGRAPSLLPRLQACTSRARDGASGPTGKRVYEQRRRKRRAASPGKWLAKGCCSHSTLLSESRFCCRPFGPATVRCCFPKLVHA